MAKHDPPRRYRLQPLACSALNIHAMSRSSLEVNSMSNEEGFLWRGAETNTLLNGTATPSQGKF
jgi:hypothetical protein